MSVELFLGVAAGGTGLLLAGKHLVHRTRERRWAEAPVLELRIPVPATDVRVASVVAVLVLVGLAGMVWLAAELGGRSASAGLWAVVLGVPLLVVVLVVAEELARAYFSPGRLRLDSERLSLRLGASEGSLWLQRPFRLRRSTAVNPWAESFLLVWDVEQDGVTVSFCYPARMNEVDLSRDRMTEKAYGTFLGNGGREVARRLLERAAAFEG